MGHSHIEVVCAALMDAEGRYLITQRRETAVLPLLWEFPGGRVKPGEAHEAALARELHYRLGLAPKVLGQICRTERIYDAYSVWLTLFRCELGPAPPEPRNVRAIAWVHSGQFDQYRFAPADERATAALLVDCGVPKALVEPGPSL